MAFEQQSLRQGQQEQPQNRVQLSLSLSTSSPTVSISDPHPAEPMTLIASVSQTASPFPDRPVTILTKYSCLESGPGADAFRKLMMESPRIVPADTQCPAPFLPLRPARYITYHHFSGDPDLLQRGEKDHFRSITIPPVDQGHAEVRLDLSPERLVDNLRDKTRVPDPRGDDMPFEDKLLLLLRPGDTYEIEPRSLQISWWAFGSMDGEDGLRRRKIARWTLPDDIPLVREPGDDETDEVSHRLRDLVDLHNVNRLASRPTYNGEQIPDIRQMRSEGWVFGEPEAGLEMRCEQEDYARFTITE